MAVPALPFPAAGADLTGWRMAGRQASSVFPRRAEKEIVSCLYVSLRVYDKRA
jgi:hypothetical protein